MSKDEEDSSATAGRINEEGRRRSSMVDDDDGIENFLTDAIGSDVDVFRAIGDSNTFAELMDVVTASFTPTETTTSSGADITSRRNSLVQDSVENDTLPASKSTSPKAQKVVVNSPPIETSTSQKIKNRLKVKLKFSPQQQQQQSQRCDNSPKNSTTKQATAASANKKQKAATSNPKKLPATTTTTSTKKKEINSSPVIPAAKGRQINPEFHKKCITKSKNVTKNGCTPCCIILYNLMETDKFSQMVTSTPSNTEPPKSSSTSINLCSISDEKVDEFHEFERKNRIYYQKLFNPTRNLEDRKHTVVQDGGVKINDKSNKLDKNIKTEIEDTSTKIKTTTTSKNDITQPSTLHQKIKCENKKKEIADKTREVNKTLQKRKLGIPSPAEIDQNKPQIHPSSSAIIEVQEADDEDVKRRAKRRREKDETKREKDKKFERLEHERKRKSSDTKKPTSDNRMSSKAFQPPTSFSPTKGLLMPSFRIPKAEGISPKKITKPQTPLAKVVEDDDDDDSSIKFGGHSTTKDRKGDDNKEDKNKHHPTSAPTTSRDHIKKEAAAEEDWETDLLDTRAAADEKDLWGISSTELPKRNDPVADNDQKTKEATVAADSHVESLERKDKKEEIENKPKCDQEPDSQSQSQVINNDDRVSIAKELPTPETVVVAAADPVIDNQIKKESQVVEDMVDDDACDSTLPSDGDRTIPPIKELQIGRFALAVTQLVQKQSDVGAITFEECFSRKCDAITEKCAWWFAKCDNEPPGFDDLRFSRLESVTSLCGSDASSDASFMGNVSDSEIRDNDTQVYEISSSTSQKKKKSDQQSSSWNSSKVVRDPDKVDEFCGHSLLQAKIRTSTGQNFRNLFDLRTGASYDKENFQAKCNLCNQLIVGKKDLATHVRGITHKENLRKLDLHMEKSTDSSTKKSANGSSNSPKRGLSIKKEKEEDEPKSSKSSSKRQDPEDSKDKKSKRERGEDKHDVKIKTEPCGSRVEYGTTSNGLSVRIPLDDDGKIFRRSTKSPESHHHDGPASSRSGGNNSDSQSPSKRRRGTRSKSPPVRIRRSPGGIRTSSRRSRSPLSPDRHPRRHSRRSSRSPRSRSPARRRRSDSEERNNKSSRHHHHHHHHRRRSPTGKSTSRRRSRSKSKSPQLLKKGNKEFHAKLALTAEGKWTDELEKQWKLMEAEEAMFREQFIDRRKELVATPEEHPRYGIEWTEFWERRYQEVEKEGKDPDTYNYVTEWKDYWSKRLNFLLQEEADEKIRDIKRKYKMDVENLNLLGKNIIQQPLPPQQQQHPERVFFEKQQSAAPIVNPTTILITGSNSSSNGHGSVVGLNMSSGGISVSSGNVVIEERGRIPERKPSVSIEDFKTTWETLTRTSSGAGSITDQTKTTHKGQDSVFIPEFSVTTPFSQPPNRTSNMSDITTSSSDASFDFMGFDLVQVLRLMCKAEDQLSFLAPKILEYYKIAEEMELKKSKGSHTLLCNEELVSLMFQARDRFMTMIRSNVLGREILQNINLTVYGLNSILDAPQCQKFRPKVPPAVFGEQQASATTAQAPNNNNITKPEEPALPKIEPLTPPSDSINEIKVLPSLVAHLSSGAKSIIAGELSKYLLLMGGQNMSNSELQEFVAKMVTPLVKQSNDSWEEKPDKPDIPDQGINKGEQRQDLNSVFDINRVPEPTVLGHDYTHSFDMRITGVSGNKAVGSALPTLPHMSYRSGNMDLGTDPPTPPRARHHNNNNPFVETTDRRANNNNNNSSTYENSLQQQPQSSRRDDGRRSPFSRRELPMNPDRY